MAEEFNHWGDIGKQLEQAASQVVRKVALDAQGNIQKHIQANGSVETGFMLNSVYTVTSDGSSYQGGDKALGEVSGPENDTTAYVAVAANYAEYVDRGTTHQPSKPFFEPGMEETRAGMDAAMDAIKSKMEGVA